MVFIPGQAITPPEPLRRRYGLFDAASGPLDLPTHGQGGGVRYVPETCGTAYAYGVTCYDGTTSPPTEPPEKPSDGDADEIETGVFAVLSTLNCSAPGYTREELERKVRRRFDAAEQAAVERALWTGLDFEGNSLDIRSLDAAAVESPYSAAGADDIRLLADVVAGLERYAYTDLGYGSVAYIHAPIEVATFAAEAGLAIPEGPGPNARKLTPLGSVWSFGAYPAGEVIISGQTTVWRSPETSVYNAFDRITNEVLLLAERTYAISFDCFAARAAFDPLEVTSP